MRNANTMLSLFLLFLATVASHASSADSRLIALVPPESPIVAGMISQPLRNHPTSFLLVTINNEIDHQDFYAVTGEDASRAIDQVVFVSATGIKGNLSEHSLIVSGHFNQDAIFRFAQGGKAKTVSYRGVSVLAVPAFARDRVGFNELRWLAILDGNVALFGSVASVQRELDRYLAKSSPDPFIMERLNRLGPNDDAWCLLPLPSSAGAVQGIFEKLDPALGALAREGGSMQYGIHFGRRVEITASRNNAAQTSRASHDGQSALQSTAGSHFLPATDNTRDNETDRTAVTVKLSLSSYKTRMAEFSKNGLATGGALSN